MEAALVIPVILVVLFAALELVSIVVTHQQLVVAAREGVRVAATVPDPSKAVSAVRNSLGEDLAGLVRVGVRRPSVVGRPAEVTVSYAKPLRVLLFKALTIPLEARAVMRVEQ